MTATLNPSIRLDHERRTEGKGFPPLTPAQRDAILAAFAGITAGGSR